MLISTENASATEVDLTAYSLAEAAKEKLGLYLNTENKSWNAELARTLCATREMLGLSTSRKKPKGKDLLELSALINSAEINSKLSNHIEGLNISVACQTGYYVKNNIIEKIIPVSTGKYGHRSDLGLFKINYKVKGWQESSLYPGSMMYKPIWYNGNEGVHGMSSDKLVYPYPASHGCVRVFKKDIEWLSRKMDRGDLVKVYGKW